MCITGDFAWLKGLQRWIISRAPSGSGATTPVGGWILSCGVTYVLSNSQSGSLFMLGSVSISLDGSGATVTPNVAFSPISLTFGGPLIGIPSSRDASASLGTPSKVG